MKRAIAAPPTPKRVQRGAKASEGEARSAQSPESELDFMDATFRVVGYQSRKDAARASRKDENSKDSVFQPNRRISISPGKTLLVSFIESNYSVPSDFETNTKFGPHSGLCYEDRLISSYEWRQLAPVQKFKAKHETDNQWKMCWKCETKGDHLSREGCPNEA